MTIRKSIMLGALALVLCGAPRNSHSTPIGDGSRAMAAEAEARDGRSILDAAIEKIHQKHPMDVVVRETDALIDGSIAKIADLVAGNEHPTAKKFRAILAKMNREIDEIRNSYGADAHSAFHLHWEIFQVKYRALRQLGGF